MSRVAVITGASSGIGEATARALVADGKEQWRRAPSRRGIPCDTGSALLPRPPADRRERPGHGSAYAAP